jgi:hypothetical protein
MQTLSVVGGNLFAIAAAQLNDATQWIRIAQLNALDDPQLSGLAVIAIPPMQPSATGGIAPQ